MAVDAEDDMLLLEHEAEGHESEAEQQEQDTETTEQAGDGEEGEEEFVLQFGDEAAPASGERETDLVKHLRNEIRERDKRLAEIQRVQPQTQEIEVGPKPTLADCDYDEEAFEASLDAWKQRQAEAEKVKTASQRQAEEANEAWQRDVQNYQSKRAELRFADVDDAEELARGRLDQVQQAVIVKAADNPALVLYSLGKHPAKLAEVSQIRDPLKLAAAVAKLEGTLKVTTRRKAPEPEDIARGNARVTQGSDKTLERLEKEADRTGDRTKIVAYKKSLKSTAK